MATLKAACHSILLFTELCSFKIFDERSNPMWDSNTPFPTPALYIPPEPSMIVKDDEDLEDQGPILQNFFAEMAAPLVEHPTFEFATRGHYTNATHCVTNKIMNLCQKQSILFSSSENLNAC